MDNKKYYIVESAEALNDLVIQINRMEKEGYECQGGLCYVSIKSHQKDNYFVEGRTYFYQAMTLKPVVAIDYSAVINKESIPRVDFLKEYIKAPVIENE